VRDSAGQRSRRTP